jgi:ferredoxin
MIRVRRSVQFAFLAMTLLAVFAFRSNAEAWCPFGGMEAIYTYLREGNLVCSLGISNFYALAALVASVLLVRRAFCSHLCPIGTISEWLRDLAARWRLPRLSAPGWVDRVLSTAKYLVLAAVVLATWQAGELVFRGYCPAYVLLSRHGADITYGAYAVAGAIVIASLVVDMPFCRWLCPLAAVLNPWSRFGLARVKRDQAACTNCGRCAKACPMAIPVDRVLQVRHARCLACMKCIDACPGRQTMPLFWGPPDRLGRRWPRAVLVGVLLGCAASAAAAAWFAPLPSFVKARGKTPNHVAVVELRVRELTCRGRANLLVGFLDRDDLHQITGSRPDQPGYYRLEAWPDPRVARIRVSYDPGCVDEETIKRAITEPYFQLAENRWWASPFVIKGYDPLGPALSNRTE